MGIETFADLPKFSPDTKLTPQFDDIKPMRNAGDLLPQFTDVLPRFNTNSDLLPDFCEGLVVDENGHARTRNQDLKGQNHPETDVPFKEKTVTTDTGEEVTGVFPEFESVFDAQLPEDLYKESDRKQFAECNRQLKEKVMSDPEYAKQFTEEQLEQIMNGDTPDGYTWHHNEETGKMQLVKSETHARTGHTGGRAIWGGGSESR